VAGRRVQLRFVYDPIPGAWVIVLALASFRAYRLG
jgi:hypothetical protein